MRAYKMHAAVTKEAFVEVMQDHREADRIVQGAYWKDGRGCAVGCGLHTVRALTGLDLAHSDHAALAAQVGVPEVLEHLQDRIFEGLPIELAREWPLRFARAIPDGADLSGVWPKFAVAMLRNLPPSPDYPDVTAAVARVATGWETGWVDDDPSARSTAESAESAAWSARSATWSAWSAAESAARSAAESARSTAWSAAWSARSAESAAESAARSAAESARSTAWSAARSAAESAAESAAWSARSAESAARSAAESAESAAWSAAESAAWSARSANWSAWSAAESARSTAYVWMAETLERLLGEAPVPGQAGDAIAGEGERG